MITKWTASIDAEPGFLHEVLEALRSYCDEDRDINLVIDAMSIKKAKLWVQSKGKFIGFPDYGSMTPINNVSTVEKIVSSAQKTKSITSSKKKNSPVKKAKKEDDNLATEALVFMAVCLRGTWKLPIAYFFQKKIQAEFQGELIKTAAKLCHEKLLRVHGITFDGCATNLKTMKYLADSLNTIEQFPHPCGGPNIHVILDACHMMKLARNAVCE